MSLHRSSSQALTLLACTWLLACSDVSGPSGTEGFAASTSDAGDASPQAGELAGAGMGAGQVAQGPAPLGGAEAAAGTLAAISGAGAGTGVVADVDASIAPPKPPCLKNGNQVVLLGDSYISWVSHTFPSDLNRESGQMFRNYAVGGTSMGSGGLGTIPPQLDQAVSENPDIITVVMDGGGNDVLVADTAQFPRGGDCKMSEMSPTIPDCQKIVDKALSAADDMLNNAVAHGISEVVYFFYPNVPEGTVIGGTHPNAILEYAVPKVQDFCDTAYDRTSGKLTCHFVDLRPVFKGHPEYFAPTDIHPNTMGSAAMAKAVWQTMKDNCLAQPAASGCCEP